MALNPVGQSLRETYDYIKQAFNHFAKVKYDLNDTSIDGKIMNAIGLYSNLYEKAATYSEKKIIDDELWFSQQALTMVLIGALIAEYFVPPGVRGNSAFAKFARRGVAYLEKHQPEQVRDDLRSFYQ